MVCGNLFVQSLQSPGSRMSQFKVPDLPAVKLIFLISFFRLPERFFFIIWSKPASGRRQLVDTFQQLKSQIYDKILAVIDLLTSASLTSLE